MQKSIHTLIPDIHKLLGRKDGWFTPELASEFGIELGKTLSASLSEERGPPTLRLSGLGDKCPRALWYSIHHPELDEQLPPSAVFKYSYGHMIEALVIALAKAAGHEVTGEQDAVRVDGITGHRDCVIDGCIVDVKSANSRSFQKFKAHQLSEDPFLNGYLYQLDGYLVGSADDPLVRVKDRAYDLAVDKILGHMYLYEHRLRPGKVEERISSYKSVVGNEVPPACTCGTLADGSSGNVKLDVKASYSPQKFSCFPNLRTFLYSEGPRYLTKVVKRPMYAGRPITEVDKHGKIVYN